MERNIDWLPVVCALTGTNPSTQACALTRNRTRDLSLCGKTPSLHLSHTGQGCCKNLMMQTSTPKQTYLRYFASFKIMRERWKVYVGGHRKLFSMRDREYVKTRTRQPLAGFWCLSLFIVTNIQMPYALLLIPYLVFICVRVCSCHTSPLKTFA